jgi:sugar-phosphatase
MTDARALFAAARALLVDLDGTLVDSSVPVARAWGAFADRNGLTLDEVLAYAHGRPSRETVAHLARPGADLDDEHARVEDSEVHDLNGLVAIPGAAELLGDPGRPLAIVTSGSTALATARLRGADLPVPDVLVSSDGLEHGKPDPAPFAIGAQRLGVDLEHCLALEDSPAGITSARRAGCRVIALRTTHPDAELGEADAIVDDLTALRG